MRTIATSSTHYGRSFVAPPTLRAPWNARVGAAFGHPSGDGVMRGAHYLAERIDARLLARLRSGELSAGELAEIDRPEADGVPVLIAMSDNGPQMRSHSTKE